MNPRQQAAVRRVCEHASPARFACVCGESKLVVVEAITGDRAELRKPSLTKFHDVAHSALTSAAGPSHRPGNHHPWISSHRAGNGPSGPAPGGPVTPAIR